MRQLYHYITCRWDNDHLVIASPDRGEAISYTVMGIASSGCRPPRNDGMNWSYL
jgi:hypothetical protein